MICSTVYVTSDNQKQNFASGYLFLQYIHWPQKNKQYLSRLLISSNAVVLKCPEYLLRGKKYIGFYKENMKTCSSILLALKDWT